MIYVLVSFIATFICAILGFLVCPNIDLDYRWGFMAFGILAALFVIDAIVAIIIRRLPEKWFNSNNKSFFPRPYEKKFCESLNIKKWKDKIPELGGFTNFHKDKIYEPNSIEFYERFILESNYGSTLHLIGAILGFAVIFMTPLKMCYLMAIPMAIVNFILCMLPYLILRYNNAKLYKVLNSLKKRQEANSVK